VELPSFQIGWSTGCELPTGGLIARHTPRHRKIVPKINQTAAPRKNFGIMPQ